MTQLLESGAVGPTLQKLDRQPFQLERLQGHITLGLPSRRHSHEGARVPLPPRIRDVQVVEFDLGGRYGILAAIVAVANSDSPVVDPNADRHFNRNTVEGNQNDLTVASHFRWAISLDEDTFHFLKELGLTVPASLLEPVIHPPLAGETAVTPQLSPSRRRALFQRPCS